MKENKPRILLYDIETAPILGYVWRLWKTNVIEVIQDWYLLSVAWQWQGEKKVHFARKSKKFADDRALTKIIWGLLDEADIVAAQNGDAFDQKKVWARFVQHGLKPPSHYGEIDTLKMARKQFKFSSNSLDNLCKTFGIGAKLPHQGKDTWLGCIAEDAASWKTMEKYNKHDVWLLAELWKKLAPYVDVVPNMQHFTGPATCINPLCGSTNIHWRGYQRTHAVVYKRYQCQSCGKWGRSLLADDGRLR